MHTARDIIAVMLLLVAPISLGLWYVIHALAGWWRRIGPLATYAVLAIPGFFLARWLWLARDTPLGRDLGTSPLQWVVIVPSAIGGWAIARQRRRQLSQRVLTGIPELSIRDEGRLVTEGIYTGIRNPRYMEFLVFVLAHVAFANYVGTWVLCPLMFPLVLGVVLLEERELRDRFGAEYEAYAGACRATCRGGCPSAWIPNRHGGGRPAPHGAN